MEYRIKLGKLLKAVLVYKTCYFPYCAVRAGIIERMRSTRRSFEPQLGRTDSKVTRGFFIYVFLIVYLGFATTSDVLIVTVYAFASVNTR